MPSILIKNKPNLFTDTNDPFVLKKKEVDEQNRAYSKFHWGQIEFSVLQYQSLVTLVTFDIFFSFGFDIVFYFISFIQTIIL